MTPYLFALYGTGGLVRHARPTNGRPTSSCMTSSRRPSRPPGRQIVGGAALQHSRTAVVSDNRGDQPVVTDGPFIETKEALGGFYLIDVRDHAQALELAAICPVGRVEVRPVLDMIDACRSDRLGVAS